MHVAVSPSTSILRLDEKVLVPQLGRPRVPLHERAQLLAAADDAVRLVRQPRPHVEDPVLGEAVDPGLLVAVVDRVAVAVQVLQDRRLGLAGGRAGTRCRRDWTWPLFSTKRSDGAIDFRRVTDLGRVGVWLGA